MPEQRLRGQSVDQLVDELGEIAQREAQAWTGQAPNRPRAGDGCARIRSARMAGDPRGAERTCVDCGRPRPGVPNAGLGSILVAGQGVRATIETDIRLHVAGVVPGLALAWTGRGLLGGGS